LWDVTLILWDVTLILWDVTLIRFLSAGYSGVNPGGVAFPANNYDSYGYGQHNPSYTDGGAGYVPVDFNALFEQYISFMQQLAQQQAYALK